MKPNPKVSAAVAAILSVPSAAIVFAQATETTSATAAGGELTEVVVTAERRSENLQNVPITIQALTAETLTQLNVTTFEDYLKFVPNVSIASWGPGQDLIVMRGLSSGALGTEGSGTDANFPNVAVYLDDQSAMMPYRNLDIYAVDIDRIEVLEGPQGTLFGAGAEAGAVRYITNKPKLDVTEGLANGGYGTTAHGDPNSNVDATINLPLIADTLAVRAVVFSDHRGGYINNVPQTFTRSPNDLGIDYAGYATGCAIGHASGGQCAFVPTPGKPLVNENSVTAFGVPPGSPSINNNAFVANAINPVTYTGFRASALWKVNEDWNVLVQQSYQNMEADGVFYQMPRGADYQFNQTPLPDLSVTTFNPSYDKDKFEDTNWTLNGKIGALNFLYTGGYLIRNVDAQQDYTNYTRGYFADFYQCTTNGSSGTMGSGTTYVHYGVKGPTSQCYSPNAWWHNTQRNTHLSNELRLSTPDDWRIRALGGAFLEQFRVYDDTDWFYKTIPPCTATFTFGCLTDITPPPTATQTISGTRPDNEAFFDDVQRGYKQYAFFGSFDFDLIPKTLTLTAGTRYYDFTNTETGSNVGSFGCQNAGVPPSLCGTNPLNPLKLDTTYSGFKSRASLVWHVTPDAMIYYTYSQGFRPGGFNRTASAHIPVPEDPALKQWVIPQAYAPDKLTNNELGWKTEWFDHRLLVNGTIYQETWDDIQLQFFNPSALGNLSFVDNGADYRVRGIELQSVARIVTGLTATATAAWNRSEQQNSPYLIANDPDLIGTPYASLLGKPITSVTNVFGMEGSHLAQSPPFQGAIRVRYEWQINSYSAFWQVAATHTASSLAYVGIIPPIAPVGSTHINYTDPGYSTYDASLGFSKDNWTAQIYGQNLTDTRGIVFTSASEAIETQTVIRPRVIGLKLALKF
jgi:iron complex outermembrane recepter protein